MLAGITKFYRSTILVALLACSGSDSVTGPEPVPTAPIVPPSAGQTNPPKVVFGRLADTLAFGDSVMQAYTVTNSSGAAITASLSWVSSDTTVILVNSTGLAKARKLGTAAVTLTATYEGVTGSATKTIYVKAAPATHLVLSFTQAPDTLAVGNTASYPVMVSTPSGLPSPATVTRSLSDTAIASLNSQGVVTAKAPGTTILTVSASHEGLSGSITKTITVVPISTAPASFTVTITGPDTLGVGEPGKQTATAVSSSGAALTAAVAWSSSSSSIASIDAIGLAMGQSIGTTTLSVVVTVAGVSTTKTKVLTVVAAREPTVYIISISFTNALDTLIKGTTERQYVTVKSGTTAVIGAVMQWTSSNTAKATVDNFGVITARDTGSVIITAHATDRGATATISKTVTIVEDVLSTINITAPDSMAEGSGFWIRAVAYGRTGRVMQGRIFTITSSSSAISIGQDGVAVANHPVSATITASTGGVSISKTVRVYSTPVPVRLNFQNAATPHQKHTAYEAALRWQNIFSNPLSGSPVSNTSASICGHGLTAPTGNFTATHGVTILVSFTDLPGDLAGRAGQCLVRAGATPGQQTTVIGYIEIDQGNYIAQSISPSRPNYTRSLLTHELGHALGFGNAETLHSGLIAPFPSGSPKWLGAKALAQFQALGGASNGVPLLGAPSSGAYKHWHNSALAGELMTDGTGDILSKITLGYLADLGYSVNMNKAESYQLP